MKTKTYYMITFSYNAGLLGNATMVNTLEEARAFIEEYKKMDDCDKNYRLSEVIITKRMFRKEESTINTIETWSEE